MKRNLFLGFPVPARRCKRWCGLRLPLGRPESVGEQGMGICTWMRLLCTPPSELTTCFIREVNTLHTRLLSGVLVTQMISCEPDYSYCSTHLELAPANVFY